MLIRIKTTLEKKYNYYSQFIIIREIKEATNKFKIENRINSLKQEIENIRFIVNQEQTPELFDAFKKYNWDIITNKHDKRNDIVDSFFYASYKILKKNLKEI